MTSKGWDIPEGEQGPGARPVSRIGFERAMKPRSSIIQIPGQLGIRLRCCCARPVNQTSTYACVLRSAAWWCGAAPIGRGLFGWLNIGLAALKGSAEGKRG